jgi:hypothetical protein
MSIRYKGGILSATPPTLVAGAGASGAWTLEQQMQATAAGNWPVNGPFYVEDVFSTYLYSGNNGAQTITNGVNLSGNGGMVWIKSRNGTQFHNIQDTARGANNYLVTNATDAQASLALNTVFNTNGFSQNNSFGGWNAASFNYASWTFRKQPKFFDVVTYSGTGGTQNVAHRLGAVPGCMIVKRTNDVSNWAVYHQSLTATQRMYLNDTTAAVTSSAFWNDTTPTSTVFTVGSGLNAIGSNYVAYLFASNAGGFGLTGSDNVVSCGNFSFVAGKTTVTLGYEPQYLLMKRYDTAGEGWWVFDTMRGMTASLSPNNYLTPNSTSVEGDLGSITQPTATGFYLDWSNNGVTTGNYIYIAIRRGPMKTPTVGTSVFTPVTYTGNGGTQTITTNIVPSLTVIKDRSVTRDNFWTDMLRGSTSQLRSNTTGAEAFDGTVTPNNTGFSLAANNGFNNSAEPFVSWNFLRAPGFFDEVCYTGTGSTGTTAHNLGVVPEMMIVKRRNAVGEWNVYHQALGNTQYIILNSNGTPTNSPVPWNNTTPTSSVFSFGPSGATGGTTGTYVAYLFATLAGVSKVGTFTGTAALQTINCGFTTGARFVLIKQTSGVGDWYIWDSARGISSSNDPYLRWNSDAVEVTATNYVDTTSVGFQVTAAASTTVNVSAATYIFLAIA